MICDAFISSEEIKLGLDSMVLFVQEFYLVLKLRDSLFVGFLLVLHVEFLNILSTTVQTA
jgi:F0F1-type ATP synthase assembly protein I